jgi:transposase
LLNNTGDLCSVVQSNFILKKKTLSGRKTSRIYKIVNRFEDGFLVDEKLKSGRPSILNNREQKHLIMTAES